MNKFSEDTSVIYHGFRAHHYGGEMFYHVGYTDLRGNLKVVWLPLEDMQPNYEDFLQQKALQHCKDYNEYVSVRELKSYLIKTETTYGTDPVPSAFTKTATYQKGDKFTLDGYTCVVTDVEKKRNFCIQEVNYERVSGYLLDEIEEWIVKVQKKFLNTHGRSEETYYMHHSEIPKLHHYKTNGDWYDALMEVVNKK